MASKGEAPWPLRRRAELGCPSSPGRQPGVRAPWLTQQSPRGPAPPSCWGEPLTCRVPACPPGRKGHPPPSHGLCRPPKRVPAHPPHAELRTEERRRAVPVMPSVGPPAPQVPQRCCCPRTPSWRRPRRRATACSVRSCSASTSPRCATTTCTAGAPRAVRTSPPSCARGVSRARPRGLSPPAPPPGVSQYTRPAPGGPLSIPAPPPGSQHTRHLGSTGTPQHS